jgi:hypothetical protein
MNNLQLDSSFIGYTISSATLRLQDLIPAGLAFIAEHDKKGLAALNAEYLHDFSEGLATCYLDAVKNGNEDDHKFFINHILIIRCDYKICHVSFSSQCFNRIFF